MATVNYSIERIILKTPTRIAAISADYTTLDFIPGDAYVVTWVLSAENLDGQWFVAPLETDVNVQAYSDDWNGQTLSFQGTNETDAIPTHPINLNSASENLFAMTADDSLQILENMVQYRPLLGGDPGANLTVKMFIVVK